MLILSRKYNESVRIFDDITITVIGINEKSVRLGFTAPGDVPIHREEIYQLILDKPEDDDAVDTR